MQQVGNKLVVSANNAIHLVSGQSRISVTDTDIIIEADSISIANGGGGIRATYDGIAANDIVSANACNQAVSASDTSANSGAANAAASNTATASSSTSNTQLS